VVDVSDDGEIANHDVGTSGLRAKHMRSDPGDRATAGHI
jgi:hypothetical protein